MWKYSEASRLMTMASVSSDNCIYCQRSLLRLPAEKFEAGQKRLLVQPAICLGCGWWTVYRIHQGEYARTAGFAESHSGTIGCLKELDLTDISNPLNEVRQYFLARKDSIYEVHPKLFEEVASSVFKDFGWSSRVTAYSGDDGVDIILDGQSGETIGVQVKRYKKERRIEAEQIRSLAGALVLGGHTEGVFITTSTFRSGAKETAKRFTALGHPIRLMDVEHFLDALGIAQLQSSEINDELITSYMLTRGEHLGTGEKKEFVQGENLRDRKIVMHTWTRDELIQMSAME